MRRKALLLAGPLVILAWLVFVSGVGFAAASGATSLKATLNARQEVPPQTFKVTRASGVFTATLVKSTKGYRLFWKLTFKNLSGKATSAYIHKGRPGRHGPAFFHLCSPCHSGAKGRAYASPAEMRLLKQGQMYVNVRTAKNPAGEIRGQIRAS
jgi:CHRD domain